MHDNQKPDEDDRYGTVIHRLELEFTDYEFAESYGDEAFSSDEPPWDVGTVGVVSLRVVNVESEFGEYVDYEPGRVADFVEGRGVRGDRVLVAIREATLVESDVFALRLSTLTASELESVKKQVASAGRSPWFFSVDPAGINPDHR